MKKATFDEFLTSVEEAGAFLKGRNTSSRGAVADDLDVLERRFRLGHTQEKFAALLGISLATLQNWEQGRRTPHGPARFLLRIAAKHLDVVLDAVRR